MQAIPTTDPSAPATGTTIDRLRVALPQAALAFPLRHPVVAGIVVGITPDARLLDDERRPMPQDRSGSAPPPSSAA